MEYGVDFSKITMEEFYEYVKEKNLMKSHAILKEDLNYYTSFFLQQGFCTMNDLYQEIKTKSKVIKFAKKYDVNENYVVILRRHLMSFEVKPRSVDDFRLMDPLDRYILDSENITNTKELFQHPNTIQRLRNQEYINSMLELTTLRYISAPFAEALFRSGYKNIFEISNANPEEMTKKINTIGKELGLFKSVFGLKDASHVVDDAKLYIKWQDHKS